MVTVLVLLLMIAWPSAMSFHFSDRSLLPA
jgi:hypothetical protein